MLCGIAAASLIAAAATLPAHAQSVPAPPTRQDIERADPPAETAAPSRLTVSGGPATAPCPLAEGASAAAGFRFAGARFDRLRGLDEAALRPAYEAFVGRSVSLATLCTIRDAAAAILRRAGYVAALTIPAQRAEDGIVRFEVVMARLVRVELRGHPAPDERRLAAYLRKLTDEPVFNSRRAERYLLLARDLPGYDVSLALAPTDGAPGDVVGIVTARRTPLVVEANVQNYGSHQAGRWGGLVTAAWNDPFGAGDRLTLGLFANAPPREQFVLQSGYERRVGGEGLTLAARFTYARTRPAVGGGDPYRSHTLVGSLEAAYPLRRSPGLSLAGRAGVDLIDQDLTVPGTTLTRDRLRAGYAALDAIAAQRVERGDTRWRLAGTLELRQGIGILGATRSCTRAGGALLCPDPLPSRLQASATATILRFTGAAELRPTPRLTLAIAPRLQYAFAPLISYEQFSSGAYTIGRGYDPGATTGDSGAGTAIELRYDAHARRGRRPAVQPYAFVDGAWVWNRDALPGERYPQRLFSAGGGVRLAFGEAARLDVVAATPLRRAPEQVTRGDTRLLVSLSTRLRPWAAR